MWGASHRRIICITLWSVLLSVAVPGWGQPDRIDDNPCIDWIFVVDTSGSMSGQDGSDNIFGEVQQTIVDFIETAREGCDSITIFTFDNNVIFRAYSDIEQGLGKHDLKRMIKELKATGSRTHMGLAINEGLTRAQQLREMRADADRLITLVLFSDGKEDVRGIRNHVSIPSNLILIPNNDKHFYFCYVSLGREEHEEKIDELMKPLGKRGRTVRAPEIDDPRTVATFIRSFGRSEEPALPSPSPTVVPTPVSSPTPQPEPPPPPKLLVRPAELDLETVYLGGKTEAKKVTTEANRDLEVLFSLGKHSDPDIVLVKPSEPVEVAASEPTNVTIQLEVATETRQGEHRVELVVQADLDPALTRTVRARFIVEKKPWGRWILLAFLASFMLAGMLLAVFCLVRGTNPVEMYRSFRERKLLEGELEVLQPNLEERTFPLQDFEETSLQLSSLLADVADLKDSDAELTVVKQDGRKMVIVTRTAGLVKVLGIEISHTTLFDGDIIELGEAEVRFNRPGYERPREEDDTIYDEEPAMKPLNQRRR